MRTRLSTISLYFLLFAMVFSSLAYLLKVVLPGQLGVIAPWIKDFFLFLFLATILCLVAIRMKLSINFRSIDGLICLYLFLCLFKYITSPMPRFFSFQSFWAMTIGPALFIFFKQIPPLDQKIIDKILKLYFIWTILMIVIAIVIYLSGQEVFFQKIGLTDYVTQLGGEQHSLTMFSMRNGEWVPRMTGLILSPLEMAFLLMLSIALAIICIKTRTRTVLYSIIIFVSFLLVSNRSIIVGTVVGFTGLWFMKLKKRYSILISMLVILMIPRLIIYEINHYTTAFLSGKTSDSAIIHMNDLLIRGPALVLDNWKGAGVGTTSGKFGLLARAKDESISEAFVGNIESFYYSLSVQLGILGLFLYLLIFLRLIFLFNSARLRYPHISSYCNGAIFGIISLLTGAVFLPVLDSRLLNIILWSIIGLSNMVILHIEGRFKQTTIQKSYHNLLLVEH